MKAELSPVDEAGEAEADGAAAANAASPSSPQNRLRLFQQDVFEQAARRPLVALG